MIKGIGCLWDPPDSRDRNACELVTAARAPASASARHLVASVLDQGAIGSCVANAGMQALRAAQIRARMAQGASLERAIALSPLGSRLMAYFLARATHGDASNDSGTYPRAFFQVVTKFGFCPEDVWPYDVFRFTQTPPHTAFRAAFDQQAPTEYRKIFESGYARVDAIKQAIADDYLVVFGTDVSQPFVNGEWGYGDPLPPPVGMRIAGGHALCVTGYDGDNFEIVNSWGSGFGDGGFFRMSADYLAWEQTRDLWIVKTAPAYSEAP